MADTTISVSKEFHDWLKSKGKKGESYEEIIKKMLKPEYLQEHGTQDSQTSSSNSSPESSDTSSFFEPEN